MTFIRACILDFFARLIVLIVIPINNITNDYASSNWGLVKQKFAVLELFHKIYYTVEFKSRR